MARATRSEWQAQQQWRAGNPRQGKPYPTPRRGLRVVVAARWLAVGLALLCAATYAGVL